jgi:hypothetical protein
MAIGKRLSCQRREARVCKLNVRAAYTISLNASYKCGTVMGNGKPLLELPVTSCQPIMCITLELKWYYLLDFCSLCISIKRIESRISASIRWRA